MVWDVLAHNPVHAFSELDCAFFLLKQFAICSVARRRVHPEHSHQELLRDYSD